VEVRDRLAFPDRSFKEYRSGMNQEDLYKLVYLDGQCPQCGGKVNELDRETTVSGREIRFFHCLACGWNDSIDVGMALWKALSSKDE
jgi:hypothetical protein